MRRFTSQDEKAAAPRRKNKSDGLHGFGSPEGMELTNRPEDEQQKQGIRNWQRRPTNVVALADTATPAYDIPIVAASTTASTTPSPPNQPPHGRPTPPDASSSYFADQFDGASPAIEVSISDDLSPGRGSQSRHLTVSFDQENTGTRLFESPSPRGSYYQRAANLTTPSPSVPDPPPVRREQLDWDPSMASTSKRKQRPSPGRYSLGRLSRARMGTPKTASAISPDRAIFGTPSRRPEAFQTPLAPDGYDSASDSESSLTEGLTPQVKSLDNLLLSTGKRLGNLGHTSFSPERNTNDSLEREEQELEEVRRQLRQELSEVDYGVLEETPLVARSPALTFFPFSEDDIIDESAPMEFQSNKSTPSRSASSRSAATGSPNQKSSQSSRSAHSARTRQFSSEMGTPSSASMISAPSSTPSSRRKYSSTSSIDKGSPSSRSTGPSISPAFAATPSRKMSPSTFPSDHGTPASRTKTAGRPQENLGTPSSKSSYSSKSSQSSDMGSQFRTSYISPMRAPWTSSPKRQVSPNKLISGQTPSGMGSSIINSITVTSSAESVKSTVSRNSSSSKSSRSSGSIPRGSFRAKKIHPVDATDEFAQVNTLEILDDLKSHSSTPESGSGFSSPTDEHNRQTGGSINKINTSMLTASLQNDPFETPTRGKSLSSSREADSPGTRSFMDRLGFKRGKAKSDAASTPSSTRHPIGERKETMASESNKSVSVGVGTALFTAADGSTVLTSPDFQVDVPGRALADDMSDSTQLLEEKKKPSTDAGNSLSFDSSLESEEPLTIPRSHLTPVRHQKAPEPPESEFRGPDELKAAQQKSHDKPVEYKPPALSMLLFNRSFGSPFASGETTQSESERDRESSKQGLLPRNVKRSDTASSSLGNVPQSPKEMNRSAYDESPITPGAMVPETPARKPSNQELRGEQFHQESNWLLRTIGSLGSPNKHQALSPIARDEEEEIRRSEIEVIFDDSPQKVLFEDYSSDEGQDESNQILTYSIEENEETKLRKQKSLDNLRAKELGFKRFIIKCFTVGIIFVAGLLLGLFLWDQTDETNSPSVSPTPTPSSPSPNTISFETVYDIAVRDGMVDNIPQENYEGDLNDSMDLLLAAIISSLPDDFSGARRRLVSGALPSSINRFEDVDCPPNRPLTDRCEEVFAWITLEDATDTWDDFKIILEIAIDIGRLQYQLDNVNPISRVEVLRPIIGPVPTDSPAVPTETPTVLQPPTNEPSLMTTLNPSNIESVPTDSPSVPTETPTVFQPPTNEPSLMPTLNPSNSGPVPTDSPSGPTETPTVFQPPTNGPSLMPTLNPSNSGPVPTDSPSGPTETPTLLPPPTEDPSLLPSTNPSISPAPTFSDLFEFLINNSFDEGMALKDEDSPQYAAYLWLSQDDQLPNYSQEKILQRYSMATLYHSTDGDNWFINDRWLSQVDECLWYSKNSAGPCNLQGELRSLDLDFNNLSGVLPRELGLLSSSLEEIVIRGGPTRVMGGSIPSELGYLTELALFFVRSNNLTGTLSSEFGNWNDMRQFDIAENSLTGTVPTEYGQLTEMTTIELRSNQFEGTIPTEFGLLRKCQIMTLGDNLLTGPIPSEIGELRRLRSFLAGSNRLEAIPSELWRLPFLETLVISENQLQGTIPSALGGLLRLRQLDLSGNQLEGNIPSQMGLLWNMRDRINLSFNQLSGSLPSEIGRLNTLRILELQGNNFSGSLPPEMSGLERVTTIRIDSNDFTGVVPIEVCTVFNETLPLFQSDCSEFEDDCPCCITCCVDNEGCECRYLGTPDEFLCFQQR